MKRLIFVTDHVDANAVGGRQQLTRLISSALREIYGDRFELGVLEESAQLTPPQSFARFGGYVNGATRHNIASIVETIGRLKIDRVVLNGSNLGRVAQHLRDRYPAIQIATYFHNCEARFFLGALRQQPSVRAAVVLLANYLAERSAVRFSDKLICLSERDSNLLHRVYGRRATHISPMAMRDQLAAKTQSIQKGFREHYALFVGGTFYANRHGIEWYVKHVAARAPIKTYVVGKRFERWKTAFERNGNVEVVGGVNDLVPWYEGAQFVIAPIFDGSGMKTKVAEALMFGKRVVGTPEAFSGYERVAAKAGVVCRTPEEFVSAMQQETEKNFVGLDPDLRALYEEHYSFQAVRACLESIVGP